MMHFIARHVRMYILYNQSKSDLFFWLGQSKSDFIPLNYVIGQTIFIYVCRDNSENMLQLQGDCLLSY